MSELSARSRPGKQFVLQPFKMPEMRVPRRIGRLNFVPENRHQGRPRLEQPPARQRRLAEERHPIPLPQGSRLLRHVERHPQAARRHQRIGHLLKPAQGLCRECLVERTPPFVELRHQIAATIEPVERDVGREPGGFRNGEPIPLRDSQIRVADGDVPLAAPAVDDLRRRSVEFRPHRIDGPAQKAPVRTAPLELGTSATELKRQTDIARHWRGQRLGIFPRRQIIEHAAEKGPMPPIVRIQLHRNIDLVDTRERVGRGVNVVRMGHRSDDGHAVGDAGHVRQVLADLQTRNGRVDRLENAANFGRRLGFRIERLVLGGRAIK